MKPNLSHFFMAIGSLVALSGLLWKTGNGFSEHAIDFLLWVTMMSGFIFIHLSRKQEHKELRKQHYVLLDGLVDHAPNKTFEKAMANIRHAWRTSAD